MDTRRAALVEALKKRLSVESYPRLTVLAALMVSGAAAGGFSALSLRAGLTSMAVRYPCASLIGYGVFLGCIRLWIAYERGRLNRGAVRVSNALSPGGGSGFGDFVPDIGLPSGGGGGPVNVPAFFAGGQSGGGGGGADFAAMVPDSGSSGSSVVSEAAKNVVGGALDALDDDAVKWLLLALAAAGAGFLAIGWVVYVAPAMLAEVAINATLVSTAYGRLRKQDLESWMAAVFRKTWIPATVLVVMMSVMGWALHKAVPSAHSVGDVVRAVMVATRAPGEGN